MPRDEISIRQFLANWDAGEYKSQDVHTQIRAGWYDWFCKDSSLPRKTENLVKKLKRIVDSHLINQDTMYVWFKNNSPMVGSLYDDIRISDQETGNPIFVIVPKSGFKGDKGAARLVKINHDVPFDDPRHVETLVEGKWGEVVTYFKNGGD